MPKYRVKEVDGNFRIEVFNWWLLSYRIYKPRLFFLHIENAKSYVDRLNKVVKRVPGQCAPEYDEFDNYKLIDPELSSAYKQLKDILDGFK